MRYTAQMVWVLLRTDQRRLVVSSVRMAFVLVLKVLNAATHVSFRKILFPVDYSCGAVIPYVKHMARRLSASVTLVHAYGPQALAHSGVRKAH